MEGTELFILGFIGGILLLGIVMSLHARSIDPPLENEEYLAKNPELLEMKREMEESEECDDSEDN